MFGYGGLIGEVSRTSVFVLTDRYLHFESHHPIHVKKGTVRCLYDRARNLTQRDESLKEESHLMKTFIGETKRRLETRLKEHKDACTRYLTDKSAIAEHAWANDHPINWAETKILQRANRTMELVMKEGQRVRAT